MAVAADLPVDAPLASPELVLVDPALAAELRRTHSPVEDRWRFSGTRRGLRSRERLSGSVGVKRRFWTRGARQRRADADNESIVATPPEQTSMDELRPSSHYPGLPAQEPEEAAFEDSPPPPLTSFEEASSESDDDASAARGGCRRGPS